MGELKEILAMHERQKFATERGMAAHCQLQNIVIDGDMVRGDAELISKIKNACGDVDSGLCRNDEFVNNIPSLQMFFCANAKTEIPIAGMINGKFASRRIDRLIVLNDTVCFLDYKTDADRNKFRDKYIVQMQEYKTLLRGIYPNYEIHGFILWTQDWVLEKIS